MIKQITFNEQEVEKLIKMFRRREKWYLIALCITLVIAFLNALVALL